MPYNTVAPMQIAYTEIINLMSKLDTLRFMIDALVDSPHNEFPKLVPSEIFELVPS